MKIFLLRLLLILCCAKAGYTIKKFNLFHHCDKRISMISNDIKDALLFYEDDSMYTDGENPCIVELWGWFENEVAMHFRSFDLDGMKTAVEIRQGDDWEDARPIAGLPKVLNSSTFNSLFQVYTSDWMAVFIGIHNPSSRLNVKLFELALNVFHTGRCFSWEYNCDNGWCIDKDLKCSGYNPCSDDSDCKTGPSSGVIAVICVSTITGASCILTVVYYIVKHYWKKRKREQNAAAISSWSQPAMPTHSYDAYPDQMYGHQVNSRWNNNDHSMNNLFDDDNSPSIQRTNRYEPPNYNSVVAGNGGANSGRSRSNTNQEDRMNNSRSRSNTIEGDRINGPRSRSNTNEERSNNDNNANRPDPPDYNTAVTWDDRLGPEPSAPSLGPQPSAPSLGPQPSAPRIDSDPNVPSEQVVNSNEVSDLPSYNEVLENQDAYRLNLPGDRSVVYQV